VREVFLFLAISATFILSWRNIWQAYREGVIWYRGDKWDRSNSPFFFWITVLLCLGFGFASPWLLYKMAMGEI
jgi:hypothetical protein